jgi:nucleoside-diphosphate-sugar epimerase
MRVAVTGAGGFLGEAVVRHLRNAGHRVIALSSTLSPTPHDDVRAWRAEQAWDLTAAALEGADAIIHAAAHIPHDQRDPNEARTCLEVNALGTLSLLRASEKVGVHRFILVSGANILKARVRPVHENDPIGCERAPYYLGSKLMAEIYVRSFQARGLKRLILRPSSIYGPNLKVGVLFSFAERLRAGLPIVLTDGGRHRADFIWRDDVALVIVKAIESTRSGVVNLGSGEAMSLVDVARMMCEILGASPDLIKIGSPGDGSGISGFSAVDIRRARRWFGYEPLSLRDGLRLWLAPAH